MLFGVVLGVFVGWGGRKIGEMIETSLFILYTWDTSSLLFGANAYIYKYLYIAILFIIDDILCVMYVMYYASMYNHIRVHFYYCIYIYIHMYLLYI